MKIGSIYMKKCWNKHVILSESEGSRTTNQLNDITGFFVISFLRMTYKKEK